MDAPLFMDWLKDQENNIIPVLYHYDLLLNKRLDTANHKEQLLKFEKGIRYHLAKVSNSKSERIFSSSHIDELLINVNCLKDTKRDYPDVHGLQRPYSIHPYRSGIIIGELLDQDSPLYDSSMTSAISHDFLDEGFNNDYMLLLNHLRENGLTEKTRFVLESALIHTTPLDIMRKLEHPETSSVIDEYTVKRYKRGSRIYNIKKHGNPAHAIALLADATDNLLDRHETELSNPNKTVLNEVGFGISIIRTLDNLIPAEFSDKIKELHAHITNGNSKASEYADRFLSILDYDEVFFLQGYISISPALNHCR